jgi:hypothetical protein
VKERLATLVNQNVSSVDYFLSELKRIKQEKYVKNLWLDNDGNIYVHMTETTAKIRVHDKGGNVKLAKIFVPELVFKIMSNKIEMVSVQPSIQVNAGSSFEYAMHSHATARTEVEFSGMCFGDGEFNSQVMMALADYKLAELAYNLRLWSKTFRKDGAYVDAEVFYFNNLVLGRPVWDSEGKEIKMKGLKDPYSGRELEKDFVRTIKENASKAVIQDVESFLREHTNTLYSL